MLNLFPVKYTWLHQKNASTTRTMQLIFWCCVFLHQSTSMHCHIFHTCQTFHTLSSFGQGIYKTLVCRTWQPSIWHNRMTCSRHSKPGVTTLYKWNNFIGSRFKVWPSIIGNLWVFIDGRYAENISAWSHVNKGSKNVWNLYTTNYGLPPVVCFVQ